MTAIPFVPDLPATQVHDSLRQSLKALEQAQQCAVLWFAEIGSVQNLSHFILRGARDRRVIHG